MMHTGRADPQVTLSRGGERTTQHFYATTYSAANATARAGERESAPFVLPAQRPTGYSSNFRVAIGYHTNMDKTDNPAILPEVVPSAVYVSRNHGDFRSPPPPAPPGHVLPPTASSASGFIKEVPQTLPRSHTVQPAPPSEAHAHFTPPRTGNRELARTAVGAERSSAHVSNEVPPQPTVREPLPLSEHHASYAAVAARKPSVLPPVASTSPFCFGTRRPYYLPDSSLQTFGLAPHEPAPAALPSTTHRAHSVHATRASPVRAETTRIEPLGCAQNTLPYVPPPPGLYYRTRMPEPPRGISKGATVGPPAEDNFARSTRTHRFTHAEQVDQSLQQQHPTVRLRQQHTYLFAS